MNAIVVNDLDVNLTDEVLQQLDIEDALDSEFCNLSLNAIAGTDKGEAIKLRAVVGNKVMQLLVDGGSSHNFVSSAFLQTCGITPTPMSPKQVQVANGELIMADKKVLSLEWWIQGHTFYTEMMVLDLGPFDAILGYDWLKPHSPMTCHWGDKTIAFEYGGQNICLQGVHSSQLNLEEISSDKLVKAIAGNDVGVFAIVEVSDSPTLEPVPAAVQDILQEFADVFEDPKVLPPPRFHDHHIPLLPNSVPVNAKPYRYSPLHKYEIEKQVKALLQAGLIIPSTSVTPDFTRKTECISRVRQDHFTHT
jgi:hypothetical protein